METGKDSSLEERLIQAIEELVRSAKDEGMPFEEVFAAVKRWLCAQSQSGASRFPQPEALFRFVEESFAGKLTIH